MAKMVGGLATNNLLLSHISQSDLAQLTPHFVRVELPRRMHLQISKKPVASAFFIEGGFASVVSGKPAREIEVGLIGPEGMTGMPIVLGARQSPSTVLMQVAGQGLRIAANDLRRAMDESSGLRETLLRYAHVLMTQIEQTAAANGRDKIESRLARWLLMVSDRVMGLKFRLTHELLGVMLGVRRASVTVSLAALERKGLVRLSRGTITIRDRGGLEDLAGIAYGTPEAEFRRLFP